jgi:hypothetical protein
MVPEAEGAEHAANLLLPQPGNLCVGQRAASGLCIHTAAHGKPLCSSIRGIYQALPAGVLAESAHTEGRGAVGEVKVKSVVEIDDGLTPCFFFKTEEGYTRCRGFDAERARTNRMDGWEEYYQEDMK